jgi:4'-phosphopantetheinyl transferase
MTNPEWSVAPYPLPLGREAVHVWRAWLTPAPALRARLEATLSPDERVRADRLREPAHRDRFVVGRGVQREILARYTGVPAAQIAFAYGRNGKPSLITKTGTDLRFNVSHSGDVALIAVTVGRDVGVDVERIRPVPRALSIAEGYFSELEARTLRTLPGDVVEHAFLTCWTRKEAFVKAAGVGLALLQCVDVGFAPGEPPRVIATRPPAPEASRWILYALEPGVGYMGALVVEAGDVALRCFDWSPAAL